MPKSGNQNVRAGGIAASPVAFALELLGRPDWALYDNSLPEWSTREDTEMVTDC